MNRPPNQNPEPDTPEPPPQPPTEVPDPPVSDPPPPPGPPPPIVAMLPSRRIVFQNKRAASRERGGSTFVLAAMRQ